MTLSITLPWPPSANNLFVNVGRKRVSSRKAVAYRAEVVAAVFAAGRPQAPAGALRVVIAAWYPDLRRRDLAGLEKAPVDALVVAGVMVDDSLIHDLRIYRAGIDRANPRITLWLEAA